ncbi:hypothetical protein B0O99DRAFT_529182 [Bisporella sp. PMI_857]|nr:hypothetical protein B0O99DRAFT_529182 [Bisporella sp. PMI_857]
MRYPGVYLAVFLLGASKAAAEACKCAPSDLCWPSTVEWDALNNTVSGRLIRSTAPGSVCYPSEPNYDETSCNVVIANWTNSAFHSADPISVTSPWANNSCYPIYPNGTSIASDPDAGERGCSIGSLPPYVINATDAGHVQAALKFARKWNLRLTVKNTGHNGAGRIWTHNMKSIHVHEAFKPHTRGSKNTETGHMAATLGAGVRDGELFDAMIKENLIAVGGTNQDVGVVGWATGGGHGFMTGKYGQGADNILEAVIVTPDGEVLTANAYQNEDIYWAIRGGGGGTFGVIVSITVKVYPMPKMEVWAINIAARNSAPSKVWWKLIAQLHYLLPGLQDQGVHGYYTITGPPSSNMITFGGSLLLWGGANGTFENAARPLQKLLASAIDIVTYTLAPLPITSFAELLTLYPVGKGGVTTSITASRLITRRTVKEKTLLLAETLEQVGPKAMAPSDGSPNFSVSGTMTLSKTPVDNALNPAWRDGVVHFITSQSWDHSLPKDQVSQIVNDVTYNKLNALRGLDPDSGAYLNEANSLEPGWQWSFFGPNYGRLHAIKKKYDLEGLLWCPQCVGSEEWVQQEDGKLCRVYNPFLQ